MIFANSCARFWRFFAVAILTTLAGMVPARADTIITVGNVFAISPSSGNALEVTLTNTGAAAVIAGFSFGFSVADPHVVFTSATINTVSPYIFSGHSLFGPNIATTSGGQTLVASDNYDLPNAGATVGTGATVGFGHVFFDVSGAPLGPIAVTLIANDTSLADAQGNNIPARLVDGTITITQSEVPEPSSLILLALGLAPLAWAKMRFRR
jgi:PEP-CTERM motif